jgi:hypothetical protein
VQLIKVGSLVVHHFVMKRGVKAGFFLIGRHAEARRELADDQNNEGADGRPADGDAQPDDLLHDGRAFSQRVDGSIGEEACQDSAQEAAGAMNAESVE